MNGSSPYDPLFQLQMNTIMEATKARSELSCSKGFKCGNSCQPRNRECPSGLSGKASNTLNKIANVIRVATNKPPVSIEFDTVGDRVLDAEKVTATKHPTTGNYRISVNDEPDFRRAVFVTPEDKSFIREYDSNQEFTNKFGNKFQYNAESDRFRLSSGTESFIMDRKDLESITYD